MAFKNTVTGKDKWVTDRNAWGFFKVCVNCRSNKKLQPVASGAMTYWASKAAFNGMIGPGKASYRLGLEDSKSGIPTRAREKEEIKKITAYSKNRSGMCMTGYGGWALR